MKTHQTSLIFTLLLLCMSCQYSQDDEASLFVFDADVRLFTAHAFMNIGGYDLEYNDSGMHPIRSEIRTRLKENLPETYKDSIRSYYMSHGRYLSYYGTYSFTLTRPPSFEIVFDSTSSSPWIAGQMEELPDLNTMLTEFYERANIEELWKEYEPRLQELHNMYRSYASVAFEDLQKYLKVEAPSLGSGKVITAFSPLLSYFQAFTTTVNGDVYLVFGPQPNDPSPSSYYHEVAHHFIDPIIEKNTDEAERLNSLFELVQQTENNIGYSIVEESFVRTIDIILTSRLFNSSDEEALQRVQDEYSLGFILCPYLYEALQQFEESGESMETYLPKLLRDVDIEAEQQRWVAFSHKHSIEH